MAKHEEIKTMKLYHHLDRIERRLKMAAAAVSSSSTRSSPLADDSASLTPTTKRPIDPEVLGTMDCLHFFGDEPLHKIQGLVERAGGAQARVLDIGTGYGGSARLLAHRTGCHVDALELQPDLSSIAEELTRRCGLEDRVTHLTGDFLQQPVQHEGYDVVVGLLCFLHIGQWRELFTRCFQSLKPGGVVYVEDFIQLGGQFTQEEKRILKEDLYCGELFTRAQLDEILSEISFEPVVFQDVTEKWTPYVAARAKNITAQLDKHIETDGEDAAKALDHFYASVAKVFARGSLGGYTLSARRPLSNQ